MPIKYLAYLRNINRNQAPALSITGSLTLIPTLLSIVPNIVSFLSGASQQLVATTYNQLGTAVTGSLYSFTSSNSPAFTVNSSGLVTAFNTGSGFITVNDISYNLSATASIIVNRLGAIPTSLNIAPNPIIILSGSTQQTTTITLDQYGQLYVAPIIVTGALGVSAISQIRNVSTFGSAGVRGIGVSAITQTGNILESSSVRGVTNLVAVVNSDRTVTLTWIDVPGQTSNTIQNSGTIIGSVAQGVQIFNTGVGGGAPGGVTGSYAFTPKYTLPSGWAYTSGQFTRAESFWNKLPGESGVILDHTAYTNVVTLTDSGNRITNRNALQAAINTAYVTAGNTIIYLDGGEWASSDGEINVPAPSGSNNGTTWVVIADKRLDPAKGVAFPRASGERLQASDESGLPTFSILSQPGTGTPGRPWSAFYLNVGARRFVTVGCHFQYDPSYLPGAHNSGNPGLNEGFFRFAYVKQTGVDGGGNPIYANTLTQASDYPAYIGTDRCSLHGRLGEAMTRAFYIPGHYIFCNNSRLYNIGTSATDSQCITTGTGAGPYLIQNNYLASGWGENIIFGGGTLFFQTEIPSDIAIINNYFDFPVAMKTYGGAGTSSNYDHKNLFELKVGHRVLLTGNQFNHYIGDGLFGSQWFAINLKAVDQAGGGGTTGWDLMSDTTVWGNQFTDCNALLQVCDASQNYGTVDFHRVEFANNLALANDTGYGSPPGRPYTMLIGGADTGWPDWATNELARPHDVDIHHNTLFLPSGVTQFTHGADSINAGTMAPLTRYTVRDNVIVFTSGTVGPYWGCENMSFNPALNEQNYTDYANSGSIWGTNAIIGSGTTVPAGDTGNKDALYTSTSSAGVNNDGTLTLSSPLNGASYDGSNMGANISYIMTAVANTTNGTTNWMRTQPSNVVYMNPNDYSVVSGSLAIVPPELPRIFIDTSLPNNPLTRTTHSVETQYGGSIVNAISASAPGDIVVCANASTGKIYFSNTGGGQVLLKVNAGSVNPTNEPIFIMSQAAYDKWAHNSGSFPAEGVRVDRTRDSGSCFRVVARGPGDFALIHAMNDNTWVNCSNYRIIGMDAVYDPGIIIDSTFSSAEQNSRPYGLIRLGFFKQAGQSVPIDSTPASFNGNIQFSRCLIHGKNPLTFLDKGIVMYCANVAVVDSDLFNIYVPMIWGGIPGDGQHLICNGPGPYKFVNNRLTGTGAERIMFGGDDFTAADGTLVYAHDVEIRRNLTDYPSDAVYGLPGYDYPFEPLSKSIFEIKLARRILIEGNYINGWRSVWPDSYRIAMCFKGVSQNGYNSLADTGDVTMRFNYLKNNGGAMAMFTPQNSSNSVTRFACYHNLQDETGGSVWGPGNQPVSGSPAYGPGEVKTATEFDGCTDVALEHNTIINQNALQLTDFSTFLQFDGSLRCDRFCAQYNVAAAGTYYMGNLGGGGYGTPALNYSVKDSGGNPTGVVTANGLALGNPANSDGRVTNIGTNISVEYNQFTNQFNNYAAGDYSIATGSAWKGVAENGTDLGANISLVNQYIVGVVSGSF